MTLLEEQLQRFRLWANTRGPEDARYGEWECDYPHWPELYSAVSAALAQPLFDSDVDNLVFALARDNECEVILDLLVSSTTTLRVATRALQSSDAEARWQAAVALGRTAHPDGLPLLRLFLSDSDEYVRRRALFEVAHLDPPFAETTAQQWLTAEPEYSRMAALVVLQIVGSRHLEGALAALENDPSEVVRNRVEGIRAGESA